MQTPPNATPQVYPVTLHAPVVQGIDPAALAQVAQLAIQGYTIATTKPIQWGRLASIGAQIVGLLAQGASNGPSPAVPNFGGMPVATFGPPIDNPVA